MAADSIPLPSQLARLPFTAGEREAFSSVDFPPLVSVQMATVLERLAGRMAEDLEAAAWYRGLSRQLFPQPEENLVLPEELADPLGARLHQATERMVHQYKNRVLVLATSRCFAHCRYCFRKSLITESLQGAGGQSSCGSCLGWPASQEIDEMAAYLAAHPEVQEVLLSGGDPLTAPFHQVEDLVARFREARPGLLVRLCTRAISFHPAVFTPRLVEGLRRLRPLWVIPHINHPAEISRRYAPESREALLRLVDSGIPVQSQTVLLRGVNDEVATLSRLFHQLTLLGVRPGYLFQCDLVPGTSHLRVPVEEGVALYHQLRRELSGLSTPVYAVDLPGGGGKFNLLELNPSLNPIQVQPLEDCYQFVKADGSVWWYPR